MLTIATERTCGENGTVRLVDGAINVTEGRLEICVNGLWGTVCNDGLTDNHGFDIDAARVVCRQLGFPEDGGLFIASSIGPFPGFSMFHAESIKH